MKSRSTAAPSAGPFLPWGSLGMEATQMIAIRTTRIR